MTVAFSTIQSQQKTNRFRQRLGWAKNVHFTGFIDLPSIKLKKDKNQVDSPSDRNIEILFPICRSNFWHFASVSYVTSRYQEPSANSVTITIIVRSAPGTGLQLFGGRNLGVTSYFAEIPLRRSTKRSTGVLLIFKSKNSIIITTSLSFNLNLLIDLILIFNLSLLRNFRTIFWEKYISSPINICYLYFYFSLCKIINNLYK